MDGWDMMGEEGERGRGDALNSKVVVLSFDCGS